MAMDTAMAKATATAKKRNNCKEPARFRAGSFLQKGGGKPLYKVLKKSAFPGRFLYE
jgi:hypothetical protein